MVLIGKAASLLRSTLTQITSCLVLVAMLAAPALAHTLKTDGNIGVLMHVDPNDEPVAGEDATFMFQIEDRNKRFSMERCECRLKITEGGKEILYSRVSGSDMQSVTVPMVFGGAGIYYAELTGNPSDGVAFAPFQVGFDIRVVPGEEETASLWRALKDGWPIAAAILAVLIGCGYFVFRRKQRRSP